MQNIGLNSDREILDNMKGTYIECESPNEMLYRFEGTLYFRDIVAPLSVDQILLRGSSLRNTDYIYGIVVYTGHETKVMKNQVQSKAKFSKLERSLNLYMIFIVLMQIIISLCAATFNCLNEIVERDNFVYLQLD
jgi:phospholipid-translocating ATPase